MLLSPTAWRGGEPTFTGLDMDFEARQSPEQRRELVTVVGADGATRRS